jgi:indolepyruvate decarboxylase
MAMPDVRPVVLVGDSGFQMACSELSTILDRKLNPIIFVLNDGAYTSEGDVNLRTWDYHLIVQLMKGGQGRLVKTEEDLEAAVKDALDSKELFVINVCLAKADVSDCLKRMTQALGKKN